jgi:hypothetical protein
VGGEANVGLGLGTLSDRQRGAQAVRDLDGFLSHLRDLGLLGTGPLTPRRRLGGWLKMGMIGTAPAEGSVLLVGDAAGLVNPLQGEGIAQAMTSARSAAEAVLLDPSRAAARYRSDLAAAHLPFQRVSATAHAALLPHPRLTSGVGRLLTAPGIGRALAGGWSIFWNGLLDGAPKSRARSLAAVASGIGQAVTAPTTTTRWFVSNYPRHGGAGRPARQASASASASASVEVAT